MENFQKPNRIEELEKKLYSQNEQGIQKKRKPLHQKEYEVPTDWQDTNIANFSESEFVTKEKKPNWFFRFFIVALVFFVGTGIYLGVTWYLNSDIDASNIDILVNAPLTISAGEVLDFEFTLQNKNQFPVQYVQIDISYPDGTRSTSDVGEYVSNINEKIESIAIGEIIKRNQRVVLFGEEGIKKEISIFLTYQVEGSTKLFKKEKKFDVVISSTPIRLTINNVKQTTTGQEVEFIVEIVSNSSKPLKDVLFQGIYPYGFSYISSTLEPLEDKKTWLIPSLQPKESITFKIKGTIDGQNKDDRYFKFLVGLKEKDSNNPEIVFSTKDTTISISRPFLELDLSINENNKDIIILDPSKSKNAVISYKNNSDYILRNAIITLKIVGSSIVEDSISVSEGFYQSLTDSITWDSSTSGKLLSIPLGKTGQVMFNFSTLTSTIEQIIINPEVLLTVNVSANRNPENQVADAITNSIIKKIRFNTEVSLETKSKYYTGAFQNEGPIPPKVEQKTTYTSVITLKNTTNAITGGVVTMKIPNYVQYEGVFGPTSESVTYDTYSRTITWNLDDIQPKTGYFGIAPREIYIQISMIPSVSQTGFTPEMVTSVQFIGTDMFTKSQVTAMGKNITSAISDAKDYYSSQVSK